MSGKKLQTKNTGGRTAFSLLLFQHGFRVFFHLLSDTKGGAKKSRLPKIG
jgi:hypothetical protein